MEITHLQLLFFESAGAGEEGWGVYGPLLMINPFDILKKKEKKRNCLVSDPEIYLLSRNYLPIIVQLNNVFEFISQS